MHLKKIFTIVYFMSVIHGLTGQNNSFCPIDTPPTRLLILWLKQVEYSRMNTGTYSHSDSIGFKLRTQHLWTETDRQPEKSFETITKLWFHYRNWYCFLEDTLALRVISNYLHHTRTWMSGGPNTDYRSLDIPTKFSIGTTGKMIRVYGKKSIPFLCDLLGDEQLMGYSGYSSEAQSLYGRHQLRRKDFAYFYLASALGEIPMAVQSQSGRDKIIQQFIEKHKAEFLKHSNCFGIVPKKE